MTTDIETGTTKEHCLSQFGFAINVTTWRTDYITSSCLSQRGILMLRAALLVGWSIILIWSMVDSALGKGYEFHWTYLTNWSAFGEWLYFVAVTYISFVVARGGVEESGGGAFRAAARVSWILGAVAPTVSFLVFAMYWVLVFKPENFQVLSVMTHGVNVIFIAVDFFFTYQPYRIQHMYLPILGGAVYNLFTAIYYAGTSNVVYDALDWGKPGAAIGLAIITCFVVIPVVYSLWFGLLRVRQFRQQKSIPSQ